MFYTCDNDYSLLADGIISESVSIDYEPIVSCAAGLMCVIVLGTFWVTSRNIFHDVSAIYKILE